MYAIARIAGKQFRIEPKSKIKVPLMNLAIGAAYEINDVLLAADGDRVLLGRPAVSEIKANATVLEHGREPKIIVFRKKRRKGFRVTRGHRQGFTWLQIEDISGF